MTAELSALIVAATSIAFLHTISGPDHYLPFVMISWARKWSVLKTTLITLLCGLGHILSSIVLGIVGISLGLAVKGLVHVESVRGNIAAWLLIAFGLVYLIWGLRRAIRNKPHVHSHAHAEKFIHKHTHSHHEEHVHIHDDEKNANTTPWVLFIIFNFEFLISFSSAPYTQTYPIRHLGQMPVDRLSLLVLLLALLTIPFLSQHSEDPLPHYSTRQGLLLNHTTLQPVFSPRPDPTGV